MSTQATSHYTWDQTDPVYYSAVARFVDGATAQGRFVQWGINLTLSGEALFRLNGHEVPARRGDLMIIASNVEIEWRVRHEPRQEPGWRCFYAVFHPRPHWYARLQFPEAAPGCAVLHLDGTPLFGTMRRLLLLADRLYRSGGPDREAGAMLVLERALLALGARRSAQLDERVHAAVEFINRRYASALTIEDIARAGHVSVSHLSALFQQQVGASPMQVLEQVRLQRAREMLRLSFASVGEVAAAVGYRSPSYFIQRFRRHCGQTPRAFRQAAKRDDPIKK